LISPAARAAALDPPRAHGAPPAVAALRLVAEDFVVEEDLGFAPAGSGAHVLLKVRKRDANTVWVARALARLAGCRAFDVGYAGLKDRRALSVQWFSVPRPRAAIDWTDVRGEGFEVLAAHPHTRKLPRGALAGNAFSVRLHALTGTGEDLGRRLAPRLAVIEREGVPNYFGPQRFGRDGANLARIGAGLAALAAPERGFVLSAARSVVFNALLAERVRDGSWRQLLAGDLANLDARGSHFAVEVVDATLRERAARLEIHPTGALWGQGTPAAGGAVGELEARIGAQFPAEAQLCVAAGMSQERRSLRLAVRELRVTPEPQALQLAFRLPRGAFATAVLRELLESLGEGAAE
jgi:tRNA pseudouridine13 synthase